MIGTRTGMRSRSFRYQLQNLQLQGPNINRADLLMEYSAAEKRKSGSKRYLNLPLMEWTTSQTVHRLKEASSTSHGHKNKSGNDSADNQEKEPWTTHISNSHRRPFNMFHDNGVKHAVVR